MRMLRFAVVVFFIVSCICFGAYEIVEWKQSDRNIPVITFDEEVLTVSASATEEELLAGVTASDVESGDLTDRIQIASLTPFDANRQRTIQYIVFDDANQLGTAVRTIVYDDYRSPRIYLKQPLRFTFNSFSNKIGNLSLSASDMIDGSLTNMLRVTYSTENGYMPEGERDITFQVNNSAGDSRILPLKMMITDEDEEDNKFYPVLSEYIVYTETEDKIDPKEYLKGLECDGFEFAFDALEDESDDEEDGSEAAEGNGNQNGEGNISDEAEDISGNEDVDRFQAAVNAAKDTRKILPGVFFEDVKIRSDVDYDEPGIYTVEYSYTSPEHVTAVTVLYVVVE